MITCFLRYSVDPDQLAEFEQYARTWVNLIERFGGTHHGYFIADETPASATFSFPGIGEEGPKNVAIALFTFPTIEAYDSYREKVAKEPECHAATARYEATKFFTRYERTFMRAVDGD